MYKRCIPIALAAGVGLIVFVSAWMAAAADQRVISFGTALEPNAQMEASRQLAESLANSGSSQWQAKGDQHRTYRFSDANADVPYRVCVPDDWDGTSELPLVMFLHGAGNDESSYLDQNNKQMVRLADEHGYLLVSPLGINGAYGTMIRLPAVFGQQEEAEKMIAARTPQMEQSQQLSEKDVINVLELVLKEYPVDRANMFITGHSMGSGGTWYHGAKYRAYWAAMAPMSGPFVQEVGYAWDSIRTMPVFMTEGTGATPSLAGSRLLNDWMEENGFDIRYKEVNADHGGMVPLVLPDVFDFFDECHNTTGRYRKQPVSIVRKSGMAVSVCYRFPGVLKIRGASGSEKSVVSIFDLRGGHRYSGVVRVVSGEAVFGGVPLLAGTYQAIIRSGSGCGYATFIAAE